MKLKTTKIPCGNPLGAMAYREPVFANADGNQATYNTNDSTSSTGGSSGNNGSNLPGWVNSVTSIGDTVSVLLGSIFPFFDKQNQRATVVPNSNDSLFKYLIFGTLAIVLILLIFRLTKK